MKGIGTKYRFLKELAQVNAPAVDDQINETLCCYNENNPDNFWCYGQDLPKPLRQWLKDEMMLSFAFILDTKDIEGNDYNSLDASSLGTLPSQGRCFNPGSTRVELWNTMAAVADKVMAAEANPQIDSVCYGADYTTYDNVAFHASMIIGYMDLLGQK